MAFKKIAVDLPEAETFVDQRAESLMRYQEGMSLSAAAEAARVSIGALRATLRKSGTTARNPSAAISLGKGGKRAKHLAEVVRRYMAGESTVSIGKDIGVAAQTVAEWLTSAGVELRSQGGSRMDPETKKKAMRMRRDGKTYRAIAEELHVSLKTLWKWLK